MKIEGKYPKNWKITATIQSPDYATEEDVRRILRIIASALKIQQVELLEDSSRAGEPQ